MEFEWDAKLDTIGTFNSTLFRHDPLAVNGIDAYDPVGSFQYAVGGDRLVGFYALSPVLTTVTRQGRRDSIPIPGFGRPLTEAMQQEFERGILTHYAADPQGYEGPLEQYLPKAYSPVAPPYLAMRVSQEGDLWLVRWNPAARSGTEGQTWDVMNSDAKITRSISLPPRLSPIWMSRDRMLLIHRDSLDVQSLRMRPIEKFDQ